MNDLATQVFVALEEIKKISKEQELTVRDLEVLFLASLLEEEV